MKWLLIVACIAGFLVVIAAAIGILVETQVMDTPSSSTLNLFIGMATAGAGIAVLSGLRIKWLQAQSAPYGRYQR